MSLACQQCSFIQYWWQTSGLCIIRRRKDDQSIPSKHAICKILCHQNKWGGHCSIGMRREFIRAKQGKTGQSERSEVEGGANKLVYKCLHIPDPPSTQDTGLLLRVPFLRAPRSLFLCLPWHRFLQQPLPEQWRLLPFVSSISLPTIEICNACGLITSQETEQALLSFFFKKH